jgi:hydroxymethylglutaryl-CoA synthase
MFSLSVRHPPTKMHEMLQIQSRLDARTKVSPAEFDEIMLLREATHNIKSYKPKGSLEKNNLFEGTWYLAGVDDKFRRSYNRLL